MAITSRLARPLLAGMFVYGGVEAIRNPGPKVNGAAKVFPEIAEPLKPLGVPQDAAQLVRATGAVQVGAGVMLAMGKLPRLSAFALAGSLLPTTVAYHRFWEEEDPEARTQQQIDFFKNAALFGGLLLAATDRGGRPSVAWMARRKAKKAADRAGDLAHRSPSSMDRAREAGEALGELASLVSAQAGRLAEVAADEGPKLAEQARSELPKVADRLRTELPRFAEQVMHQAVQAKEQARPLAEQVRHQAAQAKEQARPLAEEMRHQAVEARRQAERAMREAEKSRRKAKRKASKGRRVLALRS